MPDYPMSEKYGAVAQDEHAIGEFLEWLLAKGWLLGPEVDIDYSDTEPGPDASASERYAWGLAMLAAPKKRVASLCVGDIPRLLAKYHDIDLKQLEQERRAMLDEIRARRTADQS